MSNLRKIKQMLLGELSERSRRRCYNRQKYRTSRLVDLNVVTVVTPEERNETTDK